MPTHVPAAVRPRQFPSCTIDLGWFIHRLTSPEVAAHTLVGMKRYKYRNLWPMTVKVPNVVARFYTHPLLVDRTVDIEQLANRCELGVRLPYALSMIGDLAAPRDERGRPLKRYVAFVCYEDARDERTLIPEFDDHLALAEALWLPLLHPAGDSEKKTMLAKPVLPDGTHVYLRWGRGAPPYVKGIIHESWRHACGLALRAHFIVPVD